MMQLPLYTPADYTDAQRALLPPGAAFNWPQGGMGDVLLGGMAQELARVGGGAQQVLDHAPQAHQPKVSSWHIDEYRRIASDAIAGQVEVLPRRPCTVGCKVGARVWSHAAPNFPIPLVKVDHLLQPLRVGSKVGDGLWGSNKRYLLRVRYYRSVVNPKPLWDALLAFKQAHVFLWFEDISGVGGIYGQN